MGLYMKRLLINFFLLFSLAACSITPTAKFDFNPNTNFQQFTSYQFSPNIDISVDTNPVMIHRIQTAIDTVLTNKGLTKHKYIDKQSADITIKVNFIEEEKQSDTSFNIGFGTSMMGRHSGSSIGMNIPINGEVTIITKIIIDMNDTTQAIWHGSDIYETKEDLSIEQTDNVVNTTVHNLLASFPPNG